MDNIVSKNKFFTLWHEFQEDPTDLNPDKRFSLKRTAQYLYETGEIDGDLLRSVDFAVIQSFKKDW